MTTETPKIVRQSEGSGDENGEAIGYAEAPYLSGIARDATIANNQDFVVAVAPITNTLTATTSPPVIDRRGFTKEGCRRVAYFSPWLLSLALSWAPLARISFHEATSEILVSVIASSCEVGVVLLLSVPAALCAVFCPDYAPDPPSTSTKPSESSELTRGGKVFMALAILFYFVEPFVTGIYVLNMVDNLRCDAKNKQPERIECRVGCDLLLAIGVFRVIGIVHMLGLMVIVFGPGGSDQTEQRRRKHRQDTQV
ncbi:hypothetical protein EDB81DRAFT_949700 [Dactylonectria macrodidyma]|uniref:Uncharacterized protein n=1 Tax=Dactylonectria macrodidyma TaxID=307937 RepID=A0A9P9EBZ9_9HYPO|nr:hypothetical protein EDB81DRAFT_949700 [Dactylonectria macrodidyma]